jgi:hypothetical protein
MWKNARARSVRYAVKASSPSRSGPHFRLAMESAKSPTASPKLETLLPIEAAFTRPPT